jgi:hypothetical protein
MAGNNIANERQREKTRRPPTAESVFLAALSGRVDDTERVVIRNDVYLKALDAARKILRTYYVERKRQI